MATPIRGGEAELSCQEGGGGREENAEAGNDNEDTDDVRIYRRCVDNPEPGRHKGRDQGKDEGAKRRRSPSDCDRDQIDKQDTKPNGERSLTASHTKKQQHESEQRGVTPELDPTASCFDPSRPNRKPRMDDCEQQI